MLNTKKIGHFVILFIFLFGQLSSTTAKGQMRIQPSVTGHKSVIVETIPIRDCNSDGTGCRPASGSQQPYQTVQTLIQVDGHFFAAEAVVGQNKDHLIYLGASYAQSAKSSDMMDPETARSFQYLENSKELNKIQQNIPNIAQGIANLATSLQMAEAVHNQMKGAYEQALKNIDRIGNGIEQRAKDINELSKFNEGFANSLAGAASSKFQDPGQSENYDKYMAAYNDPWSAKKYDLSEDARKQVQSEYDKSLADGDFYTATEAARILLNQNSETLSNQAASNLRNQFKDGVIKTTPFGSSQTSPLDKATLYTSAKSPYGQAIRHVANKSQKFWLSSNSLQRSTPTESQAYIMGNAALRAADESFAGGNTARGTGLLAVADTLLDLGSGISRGLLNNLSGTVQAVPFLAGAISDFAKTAIDDPKAAAIVAGRFIRSTPGLVEAMAMDIVAKANKLQNGTAYERGEVLGDIAGELIVNWITNGTASVVKKAAKVGIVASATTRATATAAGIAERAVQRAGTIAKSFPGARGNGLIKLAQKDAIAALEVMSATERLAYHGQKDAANFIGKALAAESDYIMARGGVKKVEQIYGQISAKMKNLPRTNYEGHVTRGVESSVTLPNGTIVKNTTEDVFKTHAGMQSANGRYTLGGPEGQVGVYGVLGSEKDTAKVIAEELGKFPTEVVYDTEKFSLKNGLDLTNKEILASLGIQSSDLLIDKAIGGAYALPQVIGDIAKKNGFEFLIVPSTIKPSIKNIIIFR